MDSEERKKQEHTKGTVGSLLTLTHLTLKATANKHAGSTS